MSDTQHSKTEKDQSTKTWLNARLKAWNIVEELKAVDFDEDEWLATRITNEITSAQQRGAYLQREFDAKIAEAMRPTGGRMWTDEQNACFSALTDCAANIRADNKDEEVNAQKLRGVCA